MAYLTFFYSILEANIAAFQNADDSPSLNPSKTASCSHIIAYWVQVQPLGQILGDVIDGGELLKPSLKHPFIPPLFRTPSAVKANHQKLQEAWDFAQVEYPIQPDDWFAQQINAVLSTFAWASEHDEAVVTALGMRGDSENVRLGFLPGADRNTI